MNVRQYPRWCFRAITNGRWSYLRLILCAILLLGILAISISRPKSIVQAHIHLPWLTNVQHVQPLKCLGNDTDPNWPRPVLLEEKCDSNLTVVIVTAGPEFLRLPATLAALICLLDFRRLTEVVFLVPPQDVILLNPISLPRKLNIIPGLYASYPTILFSNTLTPILIDYKMMFKLVLAQTIQTEYYLILDSDCLAVWPIHVEQLLYNENSNSSSYRAIYQIEGKSGHSTWWSESEELLQTKLEACVPSNSSSALTTMGVTPSILSRTIALATLCRLQKLYGDERFLNKMANWALWRLLAGRMWTEYTLYYLTARCTKLFDRYHVHYDAISSRDSLPKLNLYGLSIWSLSDWTSTNQNRLIEFITKGLKWRRKELLEAQGQALIDTSVDIHSLFSVLQGRHGVSPKFYHQLFFPLYIQYLKHQNQSEN